ncbi:hypothetical protein RvY_12505 [Ramazzottius varieornatus]|uniref:Uncharacterized protein n=1 Tax=Ramazzottius varieornatus TaxID=947166 RepID=A0A1D1VNX3_RAMVA|nr:hypothetical protein RvY_12505 [Ramazzottius varieornatus]
MRYEVGPTGPNHRPGLCWSRFTNTKPTVSWTPQPQKSSLTPADLRPGQHYNFYQYFERPKDPGFISLTVLYIGRTRVELHPGSWFKTHYLWLEKGITLTQSED